MVKHGCTAMNLREKHRAEHGCPKEETRLESQKKKKSISEEGTLHVILQFTRIRATKTRDEEKRITGKYFRESAPAEVNRFYERKTNKQTKDWLAWYQTPS